MYCKIKNFPISFYSMILGLAGFVIACQKAEAIGLLPFQASNFVLMLTVFFFAAITFVYLIKIFSFQEDVKKEFSHPVKLSFFPTFSISLLLISIAFLSINKDLSKYFWVIGTVAHLIFTIKIISIWIQHSKFKINHMNPAWFIPAVGNILVPVAGTSYFPLEISWFFFSVGFFFWLVLVVIFFNRIIFHDPLAEKMLPTLFILIAPPAIGFISLVKLTGEAGEFARILYYLALFLAFLLLAQANIFYRIKYYLSWWAYSFPISAITIASMLMFHETGLVFFKYISAGFFSLLSFVILFLLTKTGKAVLANEICVVEED